MKTANATPPQPPELGYLNTLTRLLDNRFRIPGTNIRFGLDFLIGLVPYAGDLVSFLMSAAIVLSMVRHGASGRVVGLMLWNILLDTVVGGIPILGDLFDLQYKANRRNYQLLLDHYEKGKHQGSFWGVLIVVLLILLFLFLVLIWILWKLAELTFNWITT